MTVGMVRSQFKSQYITVLILLQYTEWEPSYTLTRFLTIHSPSANFIDRFDKPLKIP